jgi:hypothetical protein
MGSISFPNVVTQLRERAIDRVREGGDREHDRREQVAVTGLLEQRHDEHRHEQDPNHREQVRDVERNHVP